MVKSGKAVKVVLLIVFLLCAAVIAVSALVRTFQYAVRIDSFGDRIIFSPAPFVELTEYEEALISGPDGLPLRAVPDTAFEFEVVCGGMQTITIHYRDLFGREDKEIFELTVNRSDAMTFAERKDPTGRVPVDSYVFTPIFANG